jgi:thioesterase domain-containing protein/malonyl CoA-acyl carrier protein transacylase/acyl carrier protein
MFPGQGAQQLGMGEEWYQSSEVFRSIVDRSAEQLSGRLGLDLRELLWSPKNESEREQAEATLNRTQVTQPVLLVIEYAMAQALLGAGLQVEALIGHSLGEYVAACVAGVFEFEECLELVAGRAELMEGTAAGGMLAVMLGAAEAELAAARHGLSVAAINGRQQCVLSGSVRAIGAAQAELESRGVIARRLKSERGFHSEQMSEVLGAYEQQLERVRKSAPRLRYVSNVTGQWVSAAEAQSNGYWVRQMSAAVRWSAGIEELLGAESWVLLECGPGRVLSGLVESSARERSQPGAEKEAVTVLSTLGAPAKRSVGAVLGAAWAQGAEVDWQKYFAPRTLNRVQLPSYPFQRQRFWIDAKEAEKNPSDYREAVGKSLDTNGSVPIDTDKPAQHERPEQANAYVAPRDELEGNVASIWEELLGIATVGVHDNFFDLGGHSLVGLQLLARIQEALKVNMDPAILFDAPTVAKLSENIRSLRLGAPSSVLLSPLVPLQTKGTKQPFFCVHPMGGQAFCFVELARLLGTDQPFYGLQAPALTEVLDDASPTARLEEMAERYVNALQEVQPVGPYFLGGYSFGGFVAFEMAQQLHSRGHRVALLAILDTPAPQVFRAIADLDDAALLYGLANETARQEGSQTSLSIEELRELAPEQQLDNVFAQLQASGLLTPGQDKQWLNRFWHGYRSRQKAARNYEGRTYGEEITLFRASEVDQNMLREFQEAGVDYFESTFGWSSFSTEPVDVERVPGYHETMLQEPHVQVLAQRLKACLAKAEMLELVEIS